MNIPMKEALVVKLSNNCGGYHLGYYEHIMCCTCDECGEEFMEVVNTDPGSVEEAIGVRELCAACWDNPDVLEFY